MPDATGAELAMASVEKNMDRPARRTTVIALLCVISLGLVLSFSLFTQSDPPIAVPVYTATNVLKVSVVLTQGTNQTFYYRGRVATEADSLFRFLHLPWRTGGVRRSLPGYVGDTLWVTCNFDGRRPNPWDLNAWEVTPQGAVIDNVVGGSLVDDKRTLVFAWNFPGGFERHRGGVVHLVNATNRVELVHRGGVLYLSNPTNGAELVTLELR